LRRLSTFVNHFNWTSFSFPNTEIFLSLLVNLGDPNFTLQVVYFSKKMRPQKGILFSIPLRPSSLLNSPQIQYQLKKMFTTNWKSPQNKK
jgi:hypothetical protein